MAAEEGDLSPGRIGEHSGTDSAGQPSEFVDSVDAGEAQPVDEADAEGRRRAHVAADGNRSADE